VAQDDAGEKTESPTPRRRQEAREQGQVARSTDLTAAIVLLAGLVLLNVFGPNVFQRMLELVRETGADGDVRADGLGIVVARSVLSGAIMLAPFLVALLVITAAGGLLQTGAAFSSKLLAPKFENLEPTRGLKRVFSIDSVTRLALGLLKLLLVGAVGYSSVSGRWSELLNAGTLGVLGILHLGSEIVFTLALRMVLVLLILGLLDYFFQRWKLERTLRMTKQEVKDELKRMDGDPLLRQRRRQMQMKLAMQRLRVDVPRADVIVTNPTEYAVALQYDEASMAAPRVVAKGKDFLALQIRTIAAEHQIPIVQRPPLARGLYAAVEVGEDVPPMYYRAVAEVLAYIYQLRGRVATA
jgi:flagellar biosynthetic protein FlhB